MKINIDPDEIVHLLSELDSDQIEELLVGPCRQCRGRGHYYDWNIYIDVPCDRCEMKSSFREPTALAEGILKLIKGN